MVDCDVTEATHVQVGGQIYEIAEKWGVGPDNKLAKPSTGGYGVVTKCGRRVGMWEAQRYYVGDRQAELNKAAENAKLADEFAAKGTLKHYLLRKGFMPDNEQVAEKILDDIIEEWERLQPL